MNKIITCIIMTMFVAFTMSSCRDDAELANPGKPGHPEQEVTGTYNGTWTLSWSEKEGDYSETYPGTVSFTPGDAAYVTVVNAVCPDKSTDLTGSANIVKMSVGYKFHNDIAGNPFGCAFSGAIIDGVATMDFKITVREGRKSTVYSYQFTGTK